MRVYVVPNTCQQLVLSDLGGGAWDFFFFQYFSHSNRCVVFGITPVANNIKHLFTCLFALGISSLVKYLFRSLAFFFFSYC